MTSTNHPIRDLTLLAQQKEHFVQDIAKGNFAVGVSAIRPLRTHLNQLVDLLRAHIGELDHFESMLNGTDDVPTKPRTADPVPDIRDLPIGSRIEDRLDIMDRYLEDISTRLRRIKERI